MFSGAAEAAAIPSLLTCYCGLSEDYSPFPTRTATSPQAASTNKRKTRSAKKKSCSTNRSISCTTATTSCSTNSSSDEDSATTEKDNSLTKKTMKRASVSRRSLIVQSPPPRSRSEERASRREISDDDIDGDDNRNIDRMHRMETGDDDIGFDASNNHNDAGDHQQLQRPTHVRAMSDPFDTQKDDNTERRDDTTVEDDDFFGKGGDLIVAAAEELVTLPRFPCSETRNKNCWNEPPVSLFHVRGPKYFNNKKKVASGPYLLQARGCDLFVHNENASSATPIELEER